MPRRPTHLPILLLLAALLAPLMTLGQRPPVAQAAPASRAKLGEAIPCSGSPFGATITLGHEQELYMGFIYTGMLGAPASGQGFVRYNDDPQSNAISVQDLVTDSANGRSQISDQAGAVADLNGDGVDEFVQGFSDAAGRYQLFVQRPGTTSSELLVAGEEGHSRRAMAAGNVLGLPGAARQVVVASRSASGALSVQVFRGAADGSIAGRAALWRANGAGRAQPVQLSVAVGNLDSDGFADIVVALLQSDRKTAQVLYLEHQPGFQEGAGDDLAQGLKLRASASLTVNDVGQIGLALADANGDSVDEIVLARKPWGGAAIMLDLYTYDVVGAALSFRLHSDLPTSANSFALASGDLDGIQGGVRQEELVLGYDSNGDFGFGSGLHILALRLTDLDTERPQLSTMGFWADGTRGTNIALTTADLNKDNRAEIVASFSDGQPFGSALRFLRYDAGLHPRHLATYRSLRTDFTLGVAPTLLAGDWDNNSLRGVAQGRCERVSENHAIGAVFVPPFWQHMQDDLDKEATVGQSLAHDVSVEKSYSYTNGNSASTYVGVGAGVSLFDIVALSGAVRATASNEYSTSTNRGSSSTAGTVRTVGRSFSENGLVYQPSDYKCYSYQLYDNGAPVPPERAGVRLCEYIPFGASGAPLNGSGLDDWDRNEYERPEWVPLTRDWASLALLRGPFTSQSSNQGSAALAVDSAVGAAEQGAPGSFTSGTVARTATERHPWWQIDLGRVQPIRTVRLFAPAGGLSDFVLLVANSDFRQMSGQDNPDSLIAQPGVRAYTLADLGLGLPATATAGTTTTFLTLDSQGQPISGRYVRVQRRGVSALALAEVQVFGANHVEPDRYPLDVRDTVAGDGSFEVKLYDPYIAEKRALDPAADLEPYPWVEVRGNLHWGGAGAERVPPIAVTRGSGSTGSWSLSSVSGGSSFTGSQISTTSSVGAAFDVEAGVIVTVQGGGARSTTSGISEETTQSVSWSRSFDLGGSAPNFPQAYSGAGQEWARVCQYMFQPFFYELSDESSVGYAQRYTVLDYLVPFNGSNSGMLDRTKQQELQSCRNGNRTAVAPRATADSATVSANTPLELPVLANDVGEGLRITSVGTPQFGTASFTTRSIIYTPRPGFVGVDQLSYTVSDSRGVMTSGSVTLTVGGNPHSLFLPLVTR